MKAFDTAETSFDSHTHDHRRCVRSALQTAEALCQQHGVRLTALRRRVLELVWTSHCPVGAYDLLEMLSKDQGRVAPPTVYRALEFLLANGLIHRIESRNAFVGCPHPQEAHTGHFLICRVCGAAAELSDPGIEATLDQRAGELGFFVEAKTVELRGLCKGCRARRPDGGEQSA